MLHVTARPEPNDTWFPDRKHRPPYSSQRDNVYSYTRFQEPWRWGGEQFVLPAPVAQLLLPRYYPAEEL